jgi:hypothetical protein
VHSAHTDTNTTQAATTTVLCAPPPLLDYDRRIVNQSAAESLPLLVHARKQYIYVILWEFGWRDMSEEAIRARLNFEVVSTEK